MVSSVLSAHRWDTRDMVLFALFTALIAIGAFIRIPVPFCPFTLQLLFTTLAGLLLGSRRGAASVAVYVLLGLVTAGLHVWRRSVLYFPADLRLSHRLHRRCLSDRIHCPSKRHAIAAAPAGC